MVSRSGAFALMAVLSALGCGDGTGALAPESPLALRVVAGGGQSALAGFPLADPVVIRIETTDGVPVANQRVAVATDAPFAVVSGTAAASAADGTFPIAWRTGAAVGVQRITVSLPGSPTTEPLVIEATAASRPVRSIAGGSPAYCAVGLDGSLGCFAPFEHADSPPTLVAAPTTERFRAVAIYPTAGERSPGCATSELGRVWCFAVDAQARVSDLHELPGSYPALQSLHTGGNDPSDAPPFCALTAAGEAWCWGTNKTGTLGDGTLNDRSAPVPVQTPLRFTSLAVGSSHACGIAVGGNVWCWGRNDYGQIGRRPVGGVVPSPVPLDPDLRFARIAVVRQDVSCGIGTGGGLRCWGKKDRLGLGDLAASVEGDAIPFPTPPLDLLGTLALAAVDSAAVTIEAEGHGAWWGALEAPTELLFTDRARSFDYRLPFESFVIPVSRGALCGTTGTSAQVICVRVGTLLGYGFADRLPALRAFGVPS